MPVSAVNPVEGFVYPIMGISDRQRRAPRGVRKLVSSTKRVAVSVFGNMFGGSGTTLTLRGPVAGVEHPPEQRVEPLSAAANGVRLRRAPVPSLGLPTSTETAKLVAAPPAKRPLSWIAFLLVFAAAAAATFVAVYVNALRSGSGLATPQFLRAVFPPPGLGLRVEVQGDRFFINWDRRSPSVRSAVHGILRIEDGNQRRALYLDAAQVAAGSILYKPASGDVTFRLEVQSERGGRAVESLRVLDSLKAAGAPDDLLEPHSRPTVVPPIQGNPAPPIRTPVAPPARNNQTNTQPTEQSAPSAAPRPHDLSGLSPLSTTPAATMSRTSSFLALQTVEPRGEPEPSASAAGQQPELRLASPAEIPDGKSISMAQPARALRQVMPDVKALDMGLVRHPVRMAVQVTIDKSGRVKRARFVNNGQKVNNALARAALIAARQWRFQPAILRGRAIESEHSITFEFRPPQP
jgi:TonB family protein